MQLVNAGDLSPSTDTSISLTADPDVNGDLQPILTFDSSIAWATNIAVEATTSGGAKAYVQYSVFTCGPGHGIDVSITETIMVGPLAI